SCTTAPTTPRPLPDARPRTQQSRAPPPKRPSRSTKLVSTCSSLLLGLLPLRRQADPPVGRGVEASTRWYPLSAGSPRYSGPIVRWAIQPGESPLFGSERGCEEF